MTWKARCEFRILTPRDLCWTMVVQGELAPACLPSLPTSGPIHTMRSIVHACVDSPARTSKFCSQPLQAALLGLRGLYREVYSAFRRMEVVLALTARARNSEVSTTW